MQSIRTQHTVSHLRHALYRADTAQRLMDVMRAHWADLHPVHLRIALSQLAKLNEESSFEQRASIHTFLSRNQGLLMDAVICCMSELDSRDLSTVAQAAAKLGLSALFAVITPVALRLIDKFKARDLSSLAWAYAKLDRVQPLLMAALSQAALIHLPEMSAHDLAILSWAFAKLNLIYPRLMDAISLAVLAHVDRFNGQDLSNLAWAFAYLNLGSKELMSALSVQARSQMTQLSPQGSSNMAWALAISSPSILSDYIPHIGMHVLDADLLTQTQMFQALTALNLERELKATELCMHRYLRERVRCVTFTTSRLQKSVTNCMRTLNMNWAAIHVEHVAAPYCIDIALIGDNLKWAVEINGPSHYLSDGRPTGAEVLKQRLLQADGWKLIIIHYQAWGALETLSEKKAFLRAKLVSTQAARTPVPRPVSPKASPILRWQAAAPQRVSSPKVTQEPKPKPKPKPLKPKLVWRAK